MNEVSLPVMKILFIVLGTQGVYLSGAAQWCPSFEERVFDAVVDAMRARGETKGVPMLCVNLDVKDSHDEVGAVQNNDPGLQM